MLLLVDYSSLLYRAYHSTPPTVRAHGVYGFLGMLARILTDRRPDRVGIAIDVDWRPAFRVAELPTYKAHRVLDEPDPVTPHEAIGREVLTAIGLPVIGASGFEAEDVIATLVARVREPVQILSGDRDLFALVRDPDVKVLYPIRGVSELTDVDEAEIVRRYGIPGQSYGDYALLRGDPSDGLPGVRGIGEKTASRLLSKYGSLDAILASPSLPPAVAGRIAAATDYLAAARRVVLPVPTVPLPDVSLDMPSAPADPAELERLAHEHGLEGSVARLQAVMEELGSR